MRLRVAKKDPAHRCGRIVFVEIERAKLPPPPGMVSSLAAGFDSVARSITVIALPVMLDLLLWLGPHLRMEALLAPWIARLPALYSGVLGADTLQAAVEIWSNLAARLNILSALRTFPLGLPSLLFLEMPNQMPLGTPPAVETSSALSVLAWSVLAVLTGWLCGAVYFYWVSKVSLHPTELSFWKSIGRALVLSLLLTLLLAAVALPTLTFLSLATLISPFIGQILLFLTALATLWIIVPVYFSAHGIYTYQQDALQALLGSLRMVRFTLPSTFLFLVMLTVIGWGLRFLWLTPAAESWWLLVGILGHAFISTALLSASFIYYRDVNNWLKVVLEQLKKQAQPVRI